MSRTTRISTTAQDLRTEEFSLFHRRNDASDPQQIEESPISDSYTVIIQFKDFVSHPSWRGGRLVYSGGHLKGSIAVVYQWSEGFEGVANIRQARRRNTPSKAPFLSE
jgi:hypothetical protein